MARSGYRHCVKKLLAFLLAAAGLAAQQVTVENLTPNNFEGWKRVNVDVLPEHDAGIVDGAQYVLGRVTGDGTRALDIFVDLDGYEKKTFDLTTAEPHQFAIGALPTNLIEYFGGPVKIDGAPMQFVSLEIDGAGISSHLRARFGAMMVADLWMTWYPDQPAWARGELLLTCSNPTVPDMKEDIGETSLTFGDALTLCPGHAPNEPVIVEGASFANAQGRLLPVTFLWLRHLNVAQDWSTAGAVANLGISGIGIKDLFPHGNRPYPEATSPGETFPHRWTSPKWAGSISRLHDWQSGMVGPAKFSGTTGAQEDQVFQRGEALLPGGPSGADIVTYLAACKYANRPCHHLEADGTIVDGANHQTRLRYWDGRVHWHTGVSPNRLGKGTAGFSMQASHGWSGPDVEHWLISTLSAGHRYTGSPALAHLLKHQAHIYMLQWTHDPGSTTSQTYASRAVGWEGIGVVSLFRELHDRTLARRVRQHYRDRWLNVLQPGLDGRPGNIWDVRADRRLGFRNAELNEVLPPPEGWMPWQQSIGAYGLDLVGDVFDIAAARQTAYHAANACVVHNWVKLPGSSHYRGTGNQPFNNGTPMTMDFWQRREPFGEVVWTWGPGWFQHTWDVPAVWVVMRHTGGEDEKAAEIWQQVLTESQGGGSWFPAGQW